MKWIFFSLLLANLAFLALNLWGEGAMREGVVSKSTGNQALERTSRESEPGQTPGRIQFLSEAGQRRTRSRTPTPQETVPEQPTLVAAADEERSCMGLGPFENVISAQDVSERLSAIGFNVEMTAVDTPTGASDYRVVLPPLSSLQEAFRRLREFKSRGIDSYVITQGEDAQGISLGVFSSNGAAEDYQQQLSGLGYEVIVKVIPRVNRGYWIQIGQETFPEALLSEVTAEFVEVEVSETGCMNE